MTINRDNFEAYLLDYIEGNLDPVNSAELMAFLAENPELEMFLPGDDIQKLNTGTQLFENKNLLKKDFADVHEITNSNFDEFCIASTEGLLDQIQEKRLQDFITVNPSRRKDLSIYRNLKLKPDLSVTFPAKNKLKKQGGKITTIRFLYAAISIAATILFIVWLIPFNRYIEPQTAQTEVLEILIPRKPEGIVNSNPALSIKLPVLKTVQPMAVSAYKIPSEEIAPSEESIHNDSPIASLEPLSGNVLALSELPVPELSNHPGKQPVSKVWDDIVNSENMLQAIVSHIDFWKTAEKAISGINYLTESQLSLTKTADGMQLNTESYSIEGSKVK